MAKLTPDDIEVFIKQQLDKVALSHATFTPEAMGLIARSSEGALRSTKNLCVGALLEAVRDRVRTVDLGQVNRVLLQPHWRKRRDMTGERPAGVANRALGLQKPSMTSTLTSHVASTAIDVVCVVGIDQGFPCPC